MGKREDDEETLSRRQLLERTGAVIGLLGVAGCVDGSSGEGPPSMDGPTPAQPDGAGESSPNGPGPSSDGTPPAQTPPGSPESPKPAPGPTDGPNSTTPTTPTDMADAGPSTQPTSPVDADAGGPNTTPVTGVVVAVVKRADIDEAVAQAVAMAGGLSEIQPGQTVFIKPNAVSNRAIGTPGIRTSNEVLAAVVRLVKQRNPGRIIVGDRSARGFDSDQVFEQSGMAAAAMAAGADEIYAAPPSGASADDHWTLVQPPHYEEVWGASGGLLVMRKIVEADHLISVPTCKNHRYALFSLSLKTFVGAIGDSSRGPLHYASSIGRDFEPLGRDIALLNQAFSPLMSVIDATEALINGGPQGDGTDTVRVSTGLVMASRDRVALDTTAVSLIQHELSRTAIPSPDGSHPRLRDDRVWSLPQIENAIELGLGVGSASEAKLMFDGVAADDAMAIEAIWLA